MRVRIIASRFIWFIIIVVIWELLGRNFSNFSFVLGTPFKIYKEFIDLYQKGHLLMHFYITGAEAISGLIIGTLIGSICGLLLWYSQKATEIIRPFIIALGTLPIFAFAPLFIFWFGIGFMMKVAISGFSTVFVAFSQSNRGATTVETEYIDALKGMNATKRKIFRKVIIPASMNWVFNSMRLNVGFGLLGAFIGEFISSDKGLGYLILKASGVYNVSRAFAAAIGITILALLLHYIARLIEKHNVQILQWLSVPSEARIKRSFFPLKKDFFSKLFFFNHK
jgi:NitT/TauT family transport system permease protein